MLQPDEKPGKFFLEDSFMYVGVEAPWGLSPLL